MFIYYLRVEERKKQKVLCGGWDVREHKRKKVFVTEKLGKCVGRVCGESGVAKMFLALRFVYVLSDQFEFRCERALVRDEMALRCSSLIWPVLPSF